MVKITNSKIKALGKKLRSGDDLDVHPMNNFKNLLAEHAGRVNRNYLLSQHILQAALGLRLAGLLQRQLISDNGEVNFVLCY